MSRIDSWTAEEDKILADTVIEGVRAGRTQLESFGRVAVKIQRTKQACGYRWNAVVRYKNLEAFSEAKLEKLKEERYLKTRNGNSKAEFLSVEISSEIPVCIRLDLADPMRPEMLIQAHKPTEQDVSNPQYKFVYLNDAGTVLKIGKD